MGKNGSSAYTYITQCMSMLRTKVQGISDLCLLLVTIVRERCHSSQLLDIHIDLGYLAHTS